MDIPIELFLGFTGISIVLAIFGFLRNPQIPATIVMGGMFILLIAVATDNIISGYSSINDSAQIIETEIGNATEYHYIVESSTGNVVVANFSGFADRRGEQAGTISSMLIGDKIQCVDWYIGKTGNPNTSIPIIAGIWGTVSNIPPVFEFGRFNTTSLINDGSWHTACVEEGSEFTIGLQNVIGFMWNGTDNTNAPIFYFNDGNPYDGTNSFRVSRAFASSGWTSAMAGDVVARFYDYIPITATVESFNESIEPNIYEFTELPKTLFALIGVMIMLIGGLMVMRD